MSGVVFIVCIPTERHEKCLHTKTKKRVTIESEPQVIQITERFSINAKKFEIEKQEKDETNEIRESMEKILQNVLTQLEITNWTWTINEDQTNIQIIFPVQCSHKTEEILHVLKVNRIGKKFNSIVSVVPSSVHYQGDESDSDVELEEDETDDESDEDFGWNWFLSSVKSRLVVDQVIENVRAHAALSFDFVSMLLISTSLCALGLVENSNIYLISSMLISPMMGPVMAGTFGLVIKDKKLRKMGFKNEVIGLGLATLVGFSFGSFICLATDKYGEQDWPTYEMSSRGELRNLWTGCLTALLAGAAVALGILSDNVAMLVGVAISTSLMPPAVNAGLLWSMASVYSLKGNNTTRYSTLTTTGKYSEDSTLELLSLGAVSICLTFGNIVCIYLAGILVFKIKEVAPMTAKDSRRQFWKHDIKMARDYNKTFQKDDARKLLRAYSHQSAEHRRETRREGRLRHRSTELLQHRSTELPGDGSHLKVSRSERTWSPCTDVCRRPNAGELKELYTDLVKKKPEGRRCPKPKPYRRLSQIFHPASAGKEAGGAGDAEAGESRPLVAASPATGERGGLKADGNSPAGGKKFVVTPCENHPLSH